MTLFDATPAPVAPPVANPEPPAEVDHALGCRTTGCTRPLEAHVVTQAAIWNAAHPVPVTPRKKRKAK